MFDYHETNLYIVDYFSGREVKVSESVFNDAYEWHKANKVKMVVSYHETDRYEWADNAMNVSSTHELRSYDYNKCLKFLNLKD